jgi:hypothetical protein
VGSSDKEFEISDKKILLEGQPVPNRCVIKEIHEAQDAYFDIGDAGSKHVLSEGR